MLKITAAPKFKSARKPLNFKRHGDTAAGA